MSIIQEPNTNYKAAQQKIAEKLNVGENYKIEVAKNFCDLLYMRSYDELKFKDVKEWIGVTNALNDYLYESRRGNKDKLLCTISLFEKINNDISIANVPSIKTNQWGRYISSLDYLEFNVKDAKVVLESIAEYCLNNLIIYPMNDLYSAPSGLIENNYTKMLITKAIHDYANLKLIVQASSI